MQSSVGSVIVPSSCNMVPVSSKPLTNISFKYGRAAGNKANIVLCLLVKYEVVVCFLSRHKNVAYSIIPVPFRLHPEFYRAFFFVEVACCGVVEVAVWCQIHALSSSVSSCDILGSHCGCWCFIIGRVQSRSVIFVRLEQEKLR